MTHSISILVIEDDQTLNQQLCQLLNKKGFQVCAQYDGESGLTEAIKGLYDLIVLDVMLPKRDGFSVLKLLRQTLQTPVIMVTAKNAEEERIKGFQKGADDYLPKPFNSTELLLRIDALLRRSRADKTALVTQQQLNLDGLALCKANKCANINSQSIELTSTQFSLLWALLSNQDEVLSKPFLYQTVLKKAYGIHDRSLDMHLSRIRRKLDDAGWQGERLQTVHGKGYCLR